MRVRRYHTLLNASLRANGQWYCDEPVDEDGGRGGQPWKASGEPLRTYLRLIFILPEYSISIVVLNVEPRCYINLHFTCRRPQNGPVPQDPSTHYVPHSGLGHNPRRNRQLWCVTLNRVGALKLNFIVQSS